MEQPVPSDNSQSDNAGSRSGVMDPLLAPVTTTILQGANTVMQSAS